MPVRFNRDRIPTSFASVSLQSRSGAALPDKMRAIRAAGFDAMELGMPDLLEYGKVILNRTEAVDGTDYETIAAVAIDVRGIAASLGLKLMMLQPFANFEGWTGREQQEQRADAFARVRGWMKVMEAAGIDTLQVGSSDAEGISDSPEKMAADLAELADLLATNHFRVAYENWCWATRAPKWKDVWEIVRLADRPNLGLCLDTFQTAGSEYADPTTESGLEEGPHLSSRTELKERWRESLRELADTVPANKIFVLQISDAYKMSPPLSNDPDEQRPKSRWSHDYRPIPGQGGYLPVEDVLNAVLATGFRGYLSLEVFDWKEKEGDGDMESYTSSAMQSLTGMLEELDKK